ncbi:unnamed protein product [Allacma fusca]|uniref:Uncharacterized protein n=1 Tax=Allacma fusca TaxID=39272 RepID=A0A8J2KU51_9HEXA|nr:unnamed protein product [Allacma fusca]
MKYGALFLLIGLLVCISVHSSSALNSKCPQVGCSPSSCLPGQYKDQCKKDSECRKKKPKNMGMCCKMCCGNECV